MITLSRDDVRSLSHLDMVNGEWLDAEGVAVLLGQHPAKGIALVQRSHFPAPKWEKPDGGSLWRVADVHWWASRYTRTAEPRTDETCLYRHFDAAGRLLYVGISLCAAQRTRNHRLSAGWFRDVCNITVEWFPNREVAEAAEIAAIRGERPIHNVSGVPKTRRDRNKSENAEKTKRPKALEMMEAEVGIEPAYADLQSGRQSRKRKG